MIYSETQKQAPVGACFLLGDISFMSYSFMTDFTQKTVKVTGSVITF